MKLNYYGESPPTYGESKIGENGEKIPVETILTHKEDFCCNYCLDYFLQIIPSKGGKIKIEEKVNFFKMINRYELLIFTNSIYQHF